MTPSLWLPKTGGPARLTIFTPSLSTDVPIGNEEKKTVTMPSSMRELSSNDSVRQFKEGISEEILQETRTTRDLHDGFSTAP